MGNPGLVVHAAGKLPTIPDNGETEERSGNHLLPRSVHPFFPSGFTYFSPPHLSFYWQVIITEHYGGPFWRVLVSRSSRAYVEICDEWEE